MAELIGIGRIVLVFVYNVGRVLKFFYAGFSDQAIDTELSIGPLLNAMPKLAARCAGELVVDNTVALTALAFVSGSSSLDRTNLKANLSYTRPCDTCEKHYVSQVAIDPFRKVHF